MVLDIQDSRTGIEALPDVSSLHVDVTSPAQVEAAIRQVVHMHGRIDLLVNIAGGSGRKWGDGPADACTLESWEKTMALNLDSLFYCCKYALQVMLQQGRGVIVNVGHVKEMPDEEIYLVRFEMDGSGALGEPVGCLTDELSESAA